MHYCIGSRALSKTFVSLKGIYYQASVLGTTITWIVPHKRANSMVRRATRAHNARQVAQDVDYAVMSTFVEYYQSLVGFVNSTLCRKLGAVYPLEVRSLAYCSRAAGGDGDERGQGGGRRACVVVDASRAHGRAVDQAVGHGDHRCVRRG